MGYRKNDRKDGREKKMEEIIQKKAKRITRDCIMSFEDRQTKQEKIGGRKGDELTEYDKRGRSDLLYYEVSKLTRTGKKLAAKSAAINDENGELISELEEVKLR